MKITEFNGALELPNDRKTVLEELKRSGLGDVVAERVAEEFGYDKVLDTLKENPYQLLQIDGLAFTRVDKIALNFYSIEATDHRRQRALIWAMLDQQRNLGHTFLPTIKLEKEMQKRGVNAVTFLDEAVQAGELVLDDNRVYTSKMYEAECASAGYVRERLRRL